MRLLLVLILLTPVFAFAHSDEYATPKTWLEGFKPNYLLYGNPDSKIQLSTKAQLFDEKKLYFAYSQTMFWNIPQNSSPVTDVNFNPELFYRFDLSEDEGPISWIDAGILEHESNGREGIWSRTWNRSYVRYVLESRYENDVRVYSSFKGWIAYPRSFDDGNPDILFYRGLYEIEMTVAGLLNQRSDITLRIWAGGPSHVDPFAGGQELTLRYGGHRGKLVPLWTLQLFNGYGEDLLTYNTRRTVLRAGLSY